MKKGGLLKIDLLSGEQSPLHGRPRENVFLTAGKELVSFIVWFLG
jgi:hypothetical protein